MQHVYPHTVYLFCTVLDITQELQENTSVVQSYSSSADVCVWFRFPSLLTINAIIRHFKHPLIFNSLSGAGVSKRPLSQPTKREILFIACDCRGLISAWLHVPFGSTWQKLKIKNIYIILLMMI